MAFPHRWQSLGWSDLGSSLEPLALESIALTNYATALHSASQNQNTSSHFLLRIPLVMQMKPFAHLFQHNEANYFHLHTILDPFQVQITPNNSIVLEGGGTSFKCSVLPGAVYTWVHNGRKIDLSQTGDKYTVRQNGLLEINQVEKKDAGTYVCLAENKAGVSAASATLAVGCKCFAYS